MNYQTKSFRMIYLGVALFAAVLLPGQSTLAQTSGSTMTRFDLTKGWSFKQEAKDKWLPAVVPGAVQTDLLQNKLIEDPFYRDNEKGLQWIGKTNWEYRSEFKIDADTLKRDNLELLFEGLDTYATVYLNGSAILEANNMFRRWRVDAKPNLKEGSNELLIVFRSPINEVLPWMKKLPYQLPASNDQGEKTSPHTRKAPYQYGWDWGPRFVTMGIWRPVFLEVWDKVRIENVHFRSANLTKESGDVSAFVTFESSTETEATIVIKNLNDGSIVKRDRASVNKGTNIVATKFQIKKPRLWYPVNLGEQYLYRFQTTVEIEGKSIDSQIDATGLRSVELRQKPDKWGTSFEFVVNGIPVFAKGGNWIPADSFPTRVTKAKYRSLLGSMREANMNMVRVWGGGIYEDDYFYELADEMGILVWQDFMFACSMYPGDDAFLENVRKEAIDNIERLRNHPSIVLWCGNNEVETAWNHWGWKRELPSSIWDDYLKLFARLLPEVVEDHTDVPYWSSSPSSNFQDDSDSQKVGDVHYWGVWHGSEPFEEYEKQFPRFMSEYGFQSFPELKTVESYTNKEDRKSIDTPIMSAHQRHPRGNQLIREYMLREYEEPKDFESFLYVSQVLQADGMRIGTEHFRRIMPQNMGALYWQVNDTWPVASWSGIDYFGRWKAMHYFAKRFFEPLMVSTVLEGNNLKFYITSDYPEKRDVVLRVRALNLDGKEIFMSDSGISVEPLKGKEYKTIQLDELLKKTAKNDLVVIAELLDNGKVLSTNEHFFEPFKKLRFSKPRIKSTITKTDYGFTVALRTDRVAKAVYIDGIEGAGRLSDNFFTLVPGETKVLEFRTNKEAKTEPNTDALRIRSLIDAF